MSGHPWVRRRSRARSPARSDWSCARPGESTRCAHSMEKDANEAATANHRAGFRVSTRSPTNTRAIARRRRWLAEVVAGNARKASEIVILTCRMLHFFRAAICSTLTARQSPLDGSLHEFGRATSVARVFAYWRHHSAGASRRRVTPIPRLRHRCLSNGTVGGTSQDRGGGSQISERTFDHGRTFLKRVGFSRSVRASDRRAHGVARRRTQGDANKPERKVSGTTIPRHF